MGLPGLPGEATNVGAGGLLPVVDWWWMIPISSSG